MPLVTPTNVTALTGLTPPSTSDPANFDNRADSFLGAFPSLQAQINSVSDAAYANADHANTKAAEASASAAQASASATAAIAVSNVSKGNVATSYTEGQVVWSPISYQSYRRKAAGSGGVDPSLDTTSTTWVAITGGSGGSGADYILLQRGVF